MFYDVFMLIPSDPKKNFSNLKARWIFGSQDFLEKMYSRERLDSHRYEAGILVLAVPDWFQLFIASFLRVFEWDENMGDQWGQYLAEFCWQSSKSTE
jgi:hypothetical protein